MKHLHKMPLVNLFIQIIYHLMYILKELTLIDKLTTNVALKNICYTHRLKNIFNFNLCVIFNYKDKIDKLR